MWTVYISYQFCYWICICTFLFVYEHWHGGQEGVVPSLVFGSMVSAALVATTIELPIFSMFQGSQPLIRYANSRQQGLGAILAFVVAGLAATVAVAVFWCAAKPAPFTIPIIVGYFSHLGGLIASALLAGRFASRRSRKD